MRIYKMLRYFYSALKLRCWMSLTCASRYFKCTASASYPMGANWKDLSLPLGNITYPSCNSHRRQTGKYITDVASRVQVNVIHSSRALLVISVWPVRFNLQRSGSFEIMINRTCVYTTYNLYYSLHHLHHPGNIEVSPEVEDQLKQNCLH